MTDTGWGLAVGLYALLLAATIPVTVKVTLWRMDRQRAKEGRR